MENFVLTVHLIVALALILSVLLQRSEGGGLGIGGGGGGAASGRPATTAMAKVTWGLAICFLITLLTLTWISTQENAGGGSVIDRIGEGESAGPAELELPGTLLGDDLTPSSPADAPTAPPVSE